MALKFMQDIGSGGKPQKKKAETGYGKITNTAEFIKSLSPEHLAEYSRMDESQREFFKYLAGVPDADVSKIDLVGKKDKPPEDSGGIQASAGRSGSQSGTRQGGGNSPFWNKNAGREAQTDGFGSFASPASGSGTADRAADDAQPRRESKAPLLPAQETVWQRALRTYLGTMNNSSDSTAKENTHYEAVEDGEPQGVEERRESENRQMSHLRGHFYEDASTSEMNAVGFWKRLSDEIDEARKKHEALLSEHYDNYYDEVEEFLKQPASVTERTIKTIESISSAVKKMESQIEDVPVDPYPRWSTLNVAAWQQDRFLNDSDQKSDDYKDGWVSAYREVIKKAAEVYDIPPLLLAGVAWIEVAGDPMWTDPGMYAVREFAPDAFWHHLSYVLPEFVGQRYRDASKTSFGYVSMQLAVAANMLGIEPEDLNLITEVQLARVLSDPKMSIMFAARHLSLLKNIDFPDVPSDELTPEDIIVIANRYNMGGNVPIETIRQHYYGQRFMDRLYIINQLLYPDEG